MRRLHPAQFRVVDPAIVDPAIVDPGTVDLAQAFGSPLRPRPPGRPWITVLMIGSADGAAVVDGRSGALGGPGDQAVYRTVRALGDGVIAGAATARTERYQPLPAPRRLYIVTTTGDLGASGDLLASPTTTLVMPTDAPAPATPTTDLAALDIVRAGTGRVDLGGALAQLDGVRHLVCEGGPTINGQLFAAGLVDEVCLSLSPRFVAGESSRIAHGKSSAALEEWNLADVLADGNFLFLRYLRPGG